MKTKQRRDQHGLSNTDTYKIWENMKQRCYNPKHTKYNSYGGRGVSMCDSWKNSFLQFLFDMGFRPSKKHSVERINNNGNYCKENCRWATNVEQCSNMRKNVHVTIGGVTKIVSEWARCSGVKESTLRYRVKSGWSEAHLLDLEFGYGGVHRK